MTKFNATAKIRISKGGKFAQVFPAAVQEVIKKAADGHRISTINYRISRPTEMFYVSEGHEYVGIKSDGTVASFEVVSSNTIGAAGLSHAIGSTFQMPVGSYLIEIGYYGQYWMDVTHIQTNILGDGSSIL